MSALFEPIIWQPDDYLLFRKCGEITISPDIQNIGFNCSFCTSICLQTEVFLQHLQELHKEEIYKLYETENTTLSGEFVKVNLQDIVMQESAFNTINVNNNENENCMEKFVINENDNCIILNMLTPTELITLSSSSSSPTSSSPSTDLNFVYGLENNNLLTLTSCHQLENLITINPLEYPNNPTTFSVPSSPSSFTSSTSSSSSGSSSSTTCIKCLPDNNECEIDYGEEEDSGSILVQSPCTSECGGLSDCMSSSAEESSRRSSKSMNNFSDNWESPTKEDLESDVWKNEETYLESNKSTTTGKGKYIKTPIVRKALNNKELISYLLEAYRQNEKLWNPKHPSYKYNARRTIYNELSKPLLHDMKYNLSGVEIFAIINELRGRYRRELSKFQARKGKHKTRLWYFDQMAFLRKIIEEKRKERTKDKSNLDVDSNNNDLTNRQVLSHLLNLYKRYECLWNPNDSEYDLCDTSEIYDEIMHELHHKYQISITGKDCLNEIQKLRIRYRKELRILHKLKGLYIPKLWCFDEMDFLRPFMEEKITYNLKKNSCHTATSLNQGKHDFLKAEEIKFSNVEEQLKFIEIYRSYTSLWDADHPDYRSTNYRKKALNEMLDEVNLTIAKEKLELDQLEKTLYQMRKDFSHEKHKHLMKNITNNSEDSIESSTNFSLKVYEKLSEFLNINLGPFRCDICQQICKTYDQYKIHKSKHDGTLPFICTLCGKGFQMPGNLTIHIRRHRRDFPYSCEICKKSFATSTEVSIHMRSHSGERPYECEFCSKTFKTWSFCDIHRRTHLNQSNFHCPICDKSFYERNRFTDHMNVHLNIRKHMCEQCGKGFTTYGNLKKHLELHSPIKKYKCQPCGRSFAQFASLRWHRKTQHEQ